MDAVTAGRHSWLCHSMPDCREEQPEAKPELLQQPPSYFLFPPLLVSGSGRQERQRKRGYNHEKDGHLRVNLQLPTVLTAMPDVLVSGCCMETYRWSVSMHDCCRRRGSMATARTARPCTQHACCHHFYGEQHIVQCTRSVHAKVVRHEVSLLHCYAGPHRRIPRVGLARLYLVGLLICYHHNARSFLHLAAARTAQQADQGRLSCHST